MRRNNNQESHKEFKRHKKKKSICNKDLLSQREKRGRKKTNLV